MKKVSTTWKYVDIKRVKLTSEDIKKLHDDLLELLCEVDEHFSSKIRINDFVLEGVNEIDALSCVKKVNRFEFVFYLSNEDEYSFSNEIFKIDFADNSTPDIRYLNKPKYKHLVSSIKDRIEKHKTFSQRLCFKPRSMFVTILTFFTGIQLYIIGNLLAYIPFQPINLVYLIPLGLLFLYSILNTIVYFSSSRIVLQSKRKLITINTPVDVGGSIIGGIIGLIIGIISTLLLRLLFPLP